MSQATEVILGIGGAAGDGVASAGNTFALSLARQGLGVYAYNSYQSVIRGGHSWLRLRVSGKKPVNHGDQVDVMVALNQDTLDRHLREIAPGGVAVFNTDTAKPSYEPPPGVRLCPLPVPSLTPLYKELPIMQNTVAVGAATFLIGLDMTGLESVIATTFAKKGPKVIETNVAAAKAGYEYAKTNLPPLGKKLEKSSKKWALVTGNEVFGMGGAAAGCQFYCAYPMSPATGVLHWMAAHGEKLGICVRQLEDEIAVVNMAIGANHAVARVGMSLTDYTRAYRIGHAVLWEAILEELERHDELDPHARYELLRATSDLLFRYVDSITEILAGEYMRERDRVMRSREHKRARLAREILAGGSAGPDELGYDLELHHVGAIAWGDEAEQHMEALATGLGHSLLCVPVSEEVVWGWLGSSDPIDGAGWRTVIGSDPPAGTALAVGLCEQGRDGFVESHRQAGDARRVALETGKPVTIYRDVALEALGGRDEDAAREFVKRELRPLLGEDERELRLRETLHAYFATSQNALAAAAMLGVHEQTVAYRLRTIEKRLGCPATMRRAELETALRLHRLFSP